MHQPARFGLCVEFAYSIWLDPDGACIYDFGSVSLRSGNPGNRE